MKTTLRTSIISIFLFSFSSFSAQISATLTPVKDAYMVTYGGGQGGNSYLKFDLSSIPSGAIINNAILEVYVKSKQSGWDGDVKFFNLNNQLWQETDAASLMWTATRTDSTHQSSGFGNSTGWTSSVNLKNILLKDYTAANQFCTIFFRDPDDATMAPGTFSLTNADSLVCGNTSFNQNIVFASKENSNMLLRPKLVVNYSTTNGISVVPPYRNSRPEVYPNPASGLVTIKWNFDNASSNNVKAETMVEVFDMNGRRVFYASVPSPGDSILIDNLPKGILLVKILINEKKFQTAIIAIN